MKKRRVVPIISNCQGGLLRSALGLSSRGLEMPVFGVHLSSPKTLEGDIAQFVDSSKNADAVISVPLSDDYGLLARSRIEDTFRGRAVVFIPNLFFSGLHPDLTYVGDLGRRLVGPLGEYHSKLVLLGYVAGMDAKTIVSLFSRGIYEAVGYFDEYHRSLAEAQRRAANLTVPFAEEMDALLHEALCFMTFNHPTSFLMRAFSAKLAEHLSAWGLAERHYGSIPAYGLANPLAHAAICPIFPEIAEHFGLGFPGSYLFKPPTKSEGTIECYDLAEYIDLVLVNLRDIPREIIINSRQTGKMLVEISKILDIRI